MNQFGGCVRQSETFDFALLGIPYDEKSSFLRGTSGGPAAVRKHSSVEMINAWTELGINLEEDCVVVDHGDLAIEGDYGQVSKNIQNGVKTILDAGAVPVVLGGDHSVSYPVVRAAAEAYGPLDILHFDAHPDLYDELYGDPFSHACPFRRILEEGLAASLVQVGIRAFTGEHRKTAERFGVRWVEMKDIPPLPELAFARPLYVSIDMDSLDPAFAPGVSHYEPGGLTTRQLIQIIHRLRGDIICFDVVEVNPERDESGITAAAAGKLAMEVMGKILYERRKK